MLHDFVTQLLDKRWSPEQVAHELRIFFAGQPSRWLCTESIYQAIYDPAVCLTRPVRRRRRRRRLLGVQRRGRLTAMTMIDQRPAAVEDRVQAGHWEGDLIMGPGNRSAIGTLVERTTRFLVLLHMPEGVPTTATVRQAVNSTFGALPEGLARTLTWDQGKELAQHQQITACTGTQVFFTGEQNLRGPACPRPPDARPAQPDRTGVPHRRLAGQLDLDRQQRPVPRSAKRRGRGGAPDGAIRPLERHSTSPSPALV